MLSWWHMALHDFLILKVMADKLVASGEQDGVS